MPIREADVGLFDASLTNEIWPEELPTEDGENCRVVVMLCPAARLRGSALPAIVNPEPEMLICDSVALAFP